MISKTELIKQINKKNDVSDTHIMDLSLSTLSRICFILGSLSILGFCVVEQSAATMFCFFLFSLLGLGIAKTGGNTSARLYFLVYGWSTLSAVILYYIYSKRYGLPYFAGGSDDLDFERYARIIINSLWPYDAEEIGRLINFTTHNSKGYIYVVSLLMYFTELLDGYNTMISRMLNCSFLGLATILTRSISQQIGLTRKQALVAALWVGLCPIMVFVAIHTFRDILIAVLLLLALKMALTISIRRDYFLPILSCIVFAPISLAIVELRFLYIIPITIMVFAALFARLWPNENLRLSQVLILVIILIITLQVLEMADFTILLTAFQYLDGYGEQLAEGSDRGDAAGLGARLFVLPYPWQYYARLAYAVVTPLPVYYEDFEWNIIGISTAVQFFFATFVFLGVKLVYRNMKLLPLLGGFLVIFFSYAMGTFIFRQITAWLPFAIILAVIGYERYRCHSKIIFAACTVVFGLAGFAYAYIKI